jgi:hypothetical protein
MQVWHHLRFLRGELLELCIASRLNIVERASSALQLTADDKEQAALPRSCMRIPEELVATDASSVGSGHSFKSARCAPQSAVARNAIHGR